MKTIYMAHYVK